MLIVDDDPDFRKFGSRAVQLAFFGVPVELRSAPSGDEALATARRHIPDLMILDFDMPRFDGLMTLSGGDDPAVVLGRSPVLRTSTPTRAC